MINFIIFLLFVILLFCTISLALGIYIAHNKGYKLIWSALICFFIPLFGQLFLVFYSNKKHQTNTIQACENKNLNQTNNDTNINP